jgi:phospholipid/cholesterol/gamma-HCH transport system permease protein
MSLLKNGFSLPSNLTASLGRAVLDILQELGGVFLFFVRGFVSIFRYPFQITRIVRQLFFIGSKSVFLIAVVGLFTGMVLSLQGYYSLAKFGSEGVLGGVVALSLIRELGPVLTAIMIIARAGSAMSAEIGIMRITEQIDALFTMGVDPVRYLVSPRIVAAIISFPLLTALFDAIGILGGYITGVGLLKINSGIFVSQMDYLVVLDDAVNGFYKALAFGLLVVIICCYQGFYVHTRHGGHGAKGVSLATTSAVVYSCVGVLIADYVLTSILI